jgi:O-acetyl-ADP-ribose deacetylase (regulator of RNase III)
MKVVTGNLLEVETGLIVHQVNCLGFMGRGIAKSIREKWPKVYEAYRRRCLLSNVQEKDLLGSIQGITVNDNPLLIVVNLFGQKSIGTNGLHTDYTAFETGLVKLAQIKSERERLKDLPVCFPYGIGCGLGGGDWGQILPMLEKFFPDGLLYSLKKV